MGRIGDKSITITFDQLVAINQILAERMEEKLQKDLIILMAYGPEKLAEVEAKCGCSDHVILNDIVDVVATAITNAVEEETGLSIEEAMETTSIRDYLSEDFAKLLDEADANREEFANEMWEAEQLAIADAQKDAGINPQFN